MSSVETSVISKSYSQDTFHPDDEFPARCHLGELFVLSSSFSSSPPLHYFDIQTFIVSLN